jgi:hypothetical protein
MSFGLRPHVIDRSFKTARVNAPAGRKGFADGIDLHENIKGRRRPSENISGAEAEPQKAKTN